MSSGGRRSSSEPLALEKFMRGRDMKNYRFVRLEDSISSKYELFTIEIHTKDNCYRPQSSRMLGIEKDFYRFMSENASPEANGKLNLIDGQDIEKFYKEYKKANS